MNYKSMKIEDIIAWCQENNQVGWLKEQIALTFPVMKEVDGEKVQVLDKKGNPKERKITFIELKLAFAEKFMPEIAPKGEPKKKTMYELIEAL